MLGVSGYFLTWKQFDGFLRCKVHSYWSGNLKIATTDGHGPLKAMVGDTWAVSAQSNRIPWWSWYPCKFELYVQQPSTGSKIFGGELLRESLPHAFGLRWSPSSRESGLLFNRWALGLKNGLHLEIEHMIIIFCWSGWYQPLAYLLLTFLVPRNAKVD